MPEVWKDVSGYEGRYEISNLGRVRSLKCVAGKKGLVDRESPRAVRHSLYSNGYPFVTLSAYGATKQIMVHRLVAMTFLGEIPKGMEVHHINHDKADARLENLQLVSRLENVRAAMEYGVFRPQGQGNCNAKLTEEQVREIRSIEGVTGREIARRYNVTPSVICNIRLRKTWTHVT